MERNDLNNGYGLIVATLLVGVVTIGGFSVLLKGLVG